MQPVLSPTEKYLINHVYSCAACTEPMLSAMSLNPCGDEVDEKCAFMILENGEKCPICLCDVVSFRPAQKTRQAVSALLGEMLNPRLIIDVKSLNDFPVSSIIDRHCKVARLFVNLQKALGYATEDITLRDIDGKMVSPFKYLHEYVPCNESKHTFYLSTTGHWTERAVNYPQLFSQAYNMIGSPDENFSILYRFAIEEAIKEV